MIYTGVFKPPRSHIWWADKKACMIVLSAQVMPSRVAAVVEVKGGTRNIKLIIMGMN